MTDKNPSDRIVSANQQPIQGVFILSKESNRCSSVVSNRNINVLQDQRSDGKEVDWKGKKKRSLLVAEHLFHASKDFSKKARRMVECASFMTFKLTEKGLKLAQCYNCKGRLCSMCNWRRSMKIGFQNKKIVEVANERHNLKWIFITLTVRNCDASKLESTVHQMMKGWHRFVGYKRVKQAMRGWFRALEVTKNRKNFSKSFGTYHPHFHVLVCVEPSFFGKGYIKQVEWVSLWKKAMRLDYDPIVHVQRVKPKKDVDFEAIEEEVKGAAIKEQKAILEISKYPVKDTDVLPSDKLTAEGIETVYTLETSLAYKRLVSYGGIMKQLHKELNLDDAENGDLIHTGDDEVANAIGEVMAYWHYGVKNYVIGKEILYRNGKRIDRESGEVLGDVHS